MRNTILPFSRALVAFLLYGLCGQSASAQTTRFEPDFLDKIVATEQRATSFKTTKSNNGEWDFYGYDVDFVRLDLQVDPAVHFIKGWVTMGITLTSPLSEIHLDSHQALKIDSVRFRGMEPPAFQIDSVRVSFNRNAVWDVTGVVDTLRFYYEGSPLLDLNSFNSFVTETHEAVPVMWTLSQPYGARLWWPNKQTLSDKIESLAIKLTVPESYFAVANGSLAQVDSNPANKTKTYLWAHKYPIAGYLVAMAVTNYDSFTQIAPTVHGNILTKYFVYPESKAEWQEASVYTDSVMALFSELFGPYPFPNDGYGQAQFNWGGGMEHQTMSFMGSTSFELIAHELAHQWFGDQVTCASWQDLWLNEGFATYLSGIGYENIGGGLSWLPFKESRMRSAKEDPEGMLFAQDTSSAEELFSGTLRYDKGAMVLHMLRFQVGDNAFFKGCREYLKGRAYGFSETAYLERVMENSSGQKLSSFFDAWVYGRGYPVYDLQWATNNANQLQIRVSQQGSSTQSPYFPQAFEVRAYCRGTAKDFRIQPEFNGEIFLFQLPSKMDSLVFDPELWTLANANVVPFNGGLPPKVTVVYTPEGQPILQHQYSDDVKVTGYQISDAIGRVIYLLDQDLPPWVSSPISLPELSNGLLFLTVLGENGPLSTVKLY